MENNKYLDNNVEKLLSEKTENYREIACRNKINEIISEGWPTEVSLQRIAKCLPDAVKSKNRVEAEVFYEGKSYKSAKIKESRWSVSADFQTIDEQKGKLTFFFKSRFKEGKTDPAYVEQKHLVKNLAQLIVEFLNELKAREIVRARGPQISREENRKTADLPRLTIQQLLQKFLDRHYAEKNLYHDLMTFRVKEILLVANLYDTYIIEGEGSFADRILGEYYQLNLSSMPRITGVSSGREAMKRLRERHYDIIIIMVGVDKKAPVQISRKIKKEYPYIPSFLLLNNNSDMAYLREEMKNQPLPENLFVWNGDSKVFLAIVKLFEDQVNVENDTKVGLTKIILLVENSTRFYSKFLSILYNLVLEQTRHLIDDVSDDDFFKVMKIRARPKILLAKTYNEAIEIINRYGDYLLGVISDVGFQKDGVLYSKAGIDLITLLKEKFPNLPMVLQSSNPDNAVKASDLGVYFIYKNSETLVREIKYFISYYLGFGHFVYRDNRGRKIAVAKSIKEFEAYLRTIPEDSLIYHAMKNHFSLWLMARGEVEIARIIYPIKISDFNNLNEMRKFLINIIEQKKEEKDRGKVVNFSEIAVSDEKNIVRMAPGSLGGKGRGLAFMNTLIYNFNFSNLIPDIHIRMPKTVIIGTDEFDYFLETNQLVEIIHQEYNYLTIQEHFHEGTFSTELEEKVRIFLKLIQRPVAVRSSSLLEDSINQPFAGIFNTYLLPNNQLEFELRFQQTLEAIKMVYASIYSENARNYFQAINYKVEDEKMAVVLQEVVGETYDHYYYPHISGTAQSHNYYPYAHMKPDEGFAVSALGLGHYVVEGGKAFRFSPVYPKLEMNTPKDLFKNSQTWFYAIDLNKTEIDLKKGDLACLEKLEFSEAEKHDTLKHLVSIYDPENDVLMPGLDKSGPRILNFANILKYDYIPFARTLRVMLDVMKEAMGSPVEIEYAVDLTKGADGKASFYLLQVKPLIGAVTDYSFDLASTSGNKILLYAGKSMGNGRLEDIRDVIYVIPERFDNTKTEEMAMEIEKINRRMEKSGQKYILMGPGRWGSRDRFIGIPVVWSQISGARVIVEMSLKDFPLDASLGSHFFHNVTSMNVGYFSIDHHGKQDTIAWEVLDKQKEVEKTKYFRHVRFRKKLLVQMDGKKRKALITWEK